MNLSFDKKTTSNYFQISKPSVMHVPFETTKSDPLASKFVFPARMGCNLGFQVREKKKKKNVAISFIMAMEREREKKGTNFH
jgi:hypothetical protein